LPVQSFELFRRIATDAAGALDMAPQRGRSGSGGR